MPVALSANLADPLAVPYFLWDEPMTVRALRERLRTASTPAERVNKNETPSVTV